MPYPNATILSNDDHVKALVARKMLLINKDHVSPTSGSDEAGQDFLGIEGKPFFISWLHQWKKRIQVSK